VLYSVYRGALEVKGAMYIMSGVYNWYGHI
jgi:hypothetical protein